ncbi:hypothetical protein LU674_011225 [Pseudomonas alloputida]|uniref:Uncharacterized protein n=1 Tax=Pseudomonas alloputida TaxID=1940621 RepID=A0AAW7HRP0_9PSED|nr:MULTISPECIES: hypothetical protein [Pseudomonas]MDM3889666.1 hypothetical protein [Pseudomonas juntendi]MDM3952897.1 hypothetical protein [Pseudomonas alloputida]
MGGAVKSVANVATLGLSNAVLGDSFDTPKTDTTTAQDVDTNDVSNASAQGLADDKRRRARAAGLSSTILGGASAQAAPTATKTLLGS